MLWWGIMNDVNDYPLYQLSEGAQDLVSLVKYNCCANDMLGEGKEPKMADDEWPEDLPEDVKLAFKSLAAIQNSCKVIDEWAEKVDPHGYSISFRNRR